MKITLGKTSGSALLVTVVTAGIVGIVLLSYLSMVGTQHRLVARSTAWNAVIPIAEAGLEEALTQIKNNKQNLAADGWALSSGLTMYNGISLSGPQYYKTRTFGGGEYTTAISLTSPPVVTAQARIPTPLGADYLVRTLRVTTTNIGIFVKGIVVKDSITSNGNSVLANAYDSSNPLYSTNGKYDPAKAVDGGGIATTSTVAGKINFGSGNIYGPVSTGPGGSLPAGGPVIGTKAWAAGKPAGSIQPGYFTTDMVATFPDVQPPFTGGYSTPSSGTVNGVAYTYVLSSGNWQISSGTFNGKVLVTGDATLYVTAAAAVNFASSGSITLTTNATFKLYVGSATATLPNVANNMAPTRFQYFGLPTNTALIQNVNADFNGTVYAPSAAYTLGGNGTGSEQHINGASITKSLFYNDAFLFHYDIDVGRTGLSSGVGVATWNEL